MQPYTIPYTKGTIPPAQLWVGKHYQLIDHVQLFIQKIVCPNGGCTFCTVCIQIREQQHHAVLWFAPEKSYTIEQLNPLFETIVFQLEVDDHFFFIFQKADTLTTSCTNKLLKSIEEPPAGYHFIFLAEHTENIAPTLLSRCIIHKMHNNQEQHSSHPLYEMFTTNTRPIIEFSKIVETCSITEHETKELLDMIIHYWTTLYKVGSDKEKSKETIEKIISLLNSTYRHLPMPGSALLFWRNFYLQFIKIIVY